MQRGLCGWMGRHLRRGSPCQNYAVATSPRPVSRRLHEPVRRASPDTDEISQFPYKGSLATLLWHRTLFPLDMLASLQSDHGRLLGRDLREDRPLNVEMRLHELPRSKRQPLRKRDVLKVIGLPLLEITQVGRSC